MDMFYHFIAGLAFMTILVSLELPMRTVFIGLLMLAVGKEIYDYTFIYDVVDWSEIAKDITFTLIPYPLYCILYKERY